VECYVPAGLTDVTWKHSQWITEFKL